jgi:hypothetical protein
MPLVRWAADSDLTVRFVSSHPVTEIAFRARHSSQGHLQIHESPVAELWLALIGPDAPGLRAAAEHPKIDRQPLPTNLLPQRCWLRIAGNCPTQLMRRNHVTRIPVGLARHKLME